MESGMESRDVPATRSAARRIADAATSLRRILLRRRRLWAALSLGVAVAITLSALSPPDPPSATMRVAGRDLPAGHTVAAEDLVEVRVSPEVVPGGVARVPTGRMLAAPVRRGEPITDVRLVGEDLTATAPPGQVAVPVRISDAGQVALLTAGERIDLFATDPQAGTTLVLARQVLVLAVPEIEGAVDGALPGRLIVVGLDDSSVERVTSASVASYVTYTWSDG